MGLASFPARLVVALVATGIGPELLHAQTVLWSFTSPAGDLDRMGDFDGDGVPDVVVTDGSSGKFTPTVLSGVDGSVLYTFSESGFAGAGVAGGGDYDGDGILDVLFGDPNYLDFAGNWVGRAEVLSGAGGILFGYTGGRRANGFEHGAGACVRGMGDVDGNGSFDFAFAVWSEPQIFPVGPTRIFEFGTGFNGFFDLNWEFELKVVAPAHVITPLGDVDGDGHPDLAASYQDPQTRIGRVDVLSGLTLKALGSITGKTPYEHFGAALGSCGDVDGDGVRDLLIGVPGRVFGGTGGAVVVVSSVSGKALYELDGRTIAQRFGVDMDGLDDVDGDGVPDFVVSSDGPGARIQVFSAATGRELFRLDNTVAPRVRDVGDLDGDGHDDLAFCDGSSATAFSFRPFVGLDSVTPARVRWDLVGTVALAGSGFTADPNLVVLFDGVPATHVQITDYSALTCTPPSLLPGPHDVTVTDRFGSATLAGGLLLTPATFVDGTTSIGSPITLRYEFDALDSTFAIAGAPPIVSIPTPPFGNALAISPFIPLFILNAWPTDEYTLPTTIPNNPALVGVSVLLQALSGPKLSGPGKSGAWTNCVEITIQ